MLGKYKLNEIYCEDSYEAIKNIPDKSVDLIYVDVPYLYQKGGASSSLLGQRMVKMREALKDISDGFDYEILEQFTRVMKRINIFIWCSKAQMLDILNYFDQENEEGTKRFNVNYEILVWCKTNPVPKNNSWLSDIEYCLVFREKNFPLNEGYHLKSKFHISPINKADKDLYEHPTIKPLDLVKRHIEHTTQPGDIVADFFIGSGTTAVAAKELGRRYLGFEIDEQWCKIAKDRVNGINAHGQTSIFTFLEGEIDV